MTDPLAAIEAAAAVLGEHEDEAVRRVGGWLATYPPALLAELEVDNSATIARRDELLRQARLPAARLARELARYRSTAWIWDRLSPRCPYDRGDLRTALWLVLKIRDRDIGKRQIERILRHSQVEMSQRVGLEPGA